MNAKKYLMFFRRLVYVVVYELIICCVLASGNPVIFAMFN